MKKLIIGLGIYLCAQNLVAQETTTDTTNVLNSVVLSANRSQTTFKKLSRNVVVIDRQEIEDAPVQTVQELLEYSLNVDVRQRGSVGLQADVSIRGGNFEQTLILLNGVKLTDPQTGHHNMNIPVALKDIERIEVLHGSASRVFGPNAFSGAINIITKSSGKSQLNISGLAGENELYGLGVSERFSTGKSSTLISLSQQQSAGYIENTDFRTSNFFIQTDFKAGKFDFSINAGQTDKRFGANSYYTSVYPDQYEETRTRFASITATSGDKLKITRRVYWRRHNDRFELFRHFDNAPSWYTSHNFHETDAYGGELNAVYTHKFGTTSVGAEFRREEIISTNLGKDLDSPIDVKGENAVYAKGDSRENISLYAEHNFTYKRLLVSGGVMANHNSAFGTQFFPGIDVSVAITDEVRLYSSVNRAFRFPSFTEIYIATPTSVGKLDLKPEEAETYELGTKIYTPMFQATGSVFHRRGKNLIDFIRFNNQPTSDPFRAQNLTEANYTGVEVAININKKVLLDATGFITRLGFNYTFMDADTASNGFESTYALDFLRHKFGISLDHKIYKGLNMSWRASLQNREGGYNFYDTNTNAFTGEVEYPTFWLLDARLFWMGENYTIFVEASNILDEDYVDIGNINQPGRWIKAGFRWSIDH